MALLFRGPAALRRDSAMALRLGALVGKGDAAEAFSLGRLAIGTSTKAE